MRSVTRIGLPAVLVLASLLSACGAKAGYGDPTGNGLSTVSVEGAFGKTPSITWKALPDYPSSVETTTVINGTGAAVPADRAVEVRITISDPATDVQRQAQCANPTGALTSSAAPKPAASCPSGWPLASKPVYSTPGTTTEELGGSVNATFKKLLQGAHLGSRVMALVGSADVFGTNGAQFGVGNHDPILVIVDFLKLGAATPKPADVAPTALPTIIEKSGKPTGFTWAGHAKPGATVPFQRAILKEGTGATVALTSTVTVDYLGAVYGSTKPFDQSYTKTPAQFALTGVVKGWTYGLNGLKVGSRVVLQIPAALAYGANPPTGSGIPVNSTLYFVVDIRSAS